MSQLNHEGHPVKRQKLSNHEYSEKNSSHDASESSENDGDTKEKW